jgi:hypothetical protein
MKRALGELRLDGSLVRGFYRSRLIWLALAALVAVPLGTTLNYGNRGLGRIRESARELDVFVDRVLAYTGTEKVSLVSQGGMPQYWIKNLGGKSKVDDLVGLAPSIYGTDIQPVPRLRAAAGGLEVHKEAQRRRQHAGTRLFHRDSHGRR